MPVVIRWPDALPKRPKRTLCIHCPQPLRTGSRRFCQKHWLVDKKQRGICKDCTKPICPESESQCVFHLLRQRIRQRKAKGNAQHNQGGRGAAPIIVPEY